MAAAPRECLASAQQSLDECQLRNCHQSHSGPGPGSLPRAARPLFTCLTAWACPLLLLPPGQSGKERRTGAGQSHAPHAGLGGQVWGPPWGASCLLCLEAQPWGSSLPGSRPTASTLAHVPRKAQYHPRCFRLLWLNRQGGPRLSRGQMGAGDGVAGEEAPTPTPRTCGPRALTLTPQQEVAAGEEQQQDTLCQGTEEATDPPTHDKDEAQGQDHHDSSVQGCQERGLSVQAGTWTCPRPWQIPASTSEPCLPGGPPSQDSFSWR